MASVRALLLLLVSIFATNALGVCILDVLGDCKCPKYSKGSFQWAVRADQNQDRKILTKSLAGDQSFPCTHIGQFGAQSVSWYNGEDCTVGLYYDVECMTGNALKVYTKGWHTKLKLDRIEELGGGPKYLAVHCF
jgi:hypothetical protein